MAWNLFRWWRWLSQAPEPRAPKRRFPRSAKPRPYQPDLEQLERRWLPASLTGITEFAIPTANSGPQGITVGPDGNLWFVETSASKIAKVTTGGTITEYATTTANAGPYDIVSGPDGNLWFTENSAGQMCPSGGSRH
jgi:sugar lactone lactonase YvrE